MSRRRRGKGSLSSVLRAPSPPGCRPPARRPAYLPLCTEIQCVLVLFNYSITTRPLYLLSGHMKIFTKELKYARDGLLSDPVGEDKSPLGMYVPNGACVETGLQLYRSVRATSQLEGYHLHLRNSISPMAKAAGIEYHNRRGHFHDFRWNVRASIKAGFIPNFGHSFPWLIDSLRVVSGMKNTRKWSVFGRSGPSDWSGD